MHRTYLLVLLSITACGAPRGSAPSGAYNRSSNPETKPQGQSRALRRAEAASHTVEGSWDIHVLLRGLQYWIGEDDDDESLARALLEKQGAFVNLGRCSGAFVSPSGLILTTYNCALQVLGQHSTAKVDLLESGFVAHRAAEELDAASSRLPGAVSRPMVVASSTDITAEVLDGVDGLSLTREQNQRIDARSALALARCRSHARHHCRVAELAGGTRFVLLEEVEIPVIELVYAPPIALGNPQNVLYERSWPVAEAGFALFRAYEVRDGKQRPYESSSYLELRMTDPEVGEDVIAASFPWKYKRHSTSADMLWLLGNGELYRSHIRGQAEALDEAIARAAAARPEVEALYRWQRMYRAWQRVGVERLLAEVAGSAALRASQRKERRLLDWLKSHATASELRQYMARWALIIQMDTHNLQALPWSKVSASALIEFVRSLRAAKAEGAPVERAIEILHAFTSTADLATEIELLVRTVELLTEDDHAMRAVIPRELRRLLSEPRNQRGAAIRALFASSSLTSEPELRRQWVVSVRRWERDPAVRFLRWIEAVERSLQASRSAMPPRLEFTFYRALERSGIAPYYAGEESNLLRFAFGHVRATSHERVMVEGNAVTIHNFAATLDLGVRQGAGAPTLDRQMRLVGVFSSLSADDAFFDWYYNPKTMRSLHTSASTIVAVLRAEGAHSLLDELGH